MKPFSPAAKQVVANRQHAGMDYLPPVQPVVEGISFNYIFTIAFMPPTGYIYVRRQTRLLTCILSLGFFPLGVQL